MQAGLEAYIQENYPLALGYFTQTLEYGKLTDVEMAHVRCSRGKVYAGMELWDSAITDYDNYIRTAPPDISLLDCHFHRGIAYERKGEMEKAVADYDKVVEGCALIESEELPTLHARVHLLRGCARESVDKITKAEEDLRCVNLPLLKLNEANYFLPLLKTKIEMAKRILREQRSQEKPSSGSESTSSKNSRKRLALEPSPQNKSRRLNDTRDSEDIGETSSISKETGLKSHDNQYYSPHLSSDHD
jgi:tetratricopeptide (TPR) repeat protein